MVTIKVGSLLNGCRIGEIQSVGLMQVIPLLNPRTDEDRWASPGEAIVGTHNYGAVSVCNPTGRLMIVPMNAAWMTKKGAQDHATTTASMVKPQSREQINNSLCVEENQGGLIPDDNYRLSIMPAALRTDAARMASESVNYGSLWRRIEKFNNEMGSGSRGHLRDFFDRFDKELDEFIAQFEPVPTQVGAIILIGGEITGIERAPSQYAWLGVWEALIRDCYGSRAMQAEKRMANKVVPDTRARLGEINTVEDLLSAVEDAERREQAGVQALVDRLSEDDLEVTEPYRHSVHGNLRVQMVKNNRITGQVVIEDEDIVYASMVNAGA